MKKYTLFLFFLQTFLFAQSNENLQIKKYLKGNITEKTQAIKSAEDEEAEKLTSLAIDFCIENKSYFENDREIDGLAVASVFSISEDYVKNANENQKNQITKKLIELYNCFKTSSTVQIAILSKITSLKNLISTSDFTSLINNELFQIEPLNINPGLFNALLNCANNIGNNETFLILFSFLQNKKLTQFFPQIESTASLLLSLSLNEILNIVNESDLQKIQIILQLLKKNSQISSNFSCTIAENLLSQTILIVENSSKVLSDYEEVILIQMQALEILTKNNWTRSSKTGVDFFNFAKKSYENGKIKTSDFETVIKSLSEIAPIDCVQTLIIYLEELNDKTEVGNLPSEQIVLSVINTLGAIGDKSAFDSLLEVTYLNYSESVLTAARQALSGLRWQ